MAGPVLSSLAIRSYRHTDQQAVRTIACETAARGEPVERFFRDREVFADLLTRYYTEWEPHSLWVAERDGQVIGYLTGCLDTRRYHRLMTWRIIPAAACRGVCRGVLFHRETWRLAQAAIETCRVGGFTHSHFLQSYPAHLHVNIQRPFRGQHVGHSLVTRFLQQAETAGVPGIHAAVRGNNPAACRFFEGLEFTPLHRARVAVPSGKTLEFSETIVYGKRL